jgi:Tfp pilus assembly protein PilN
MSQQINLFNSSLLKKSTFFTPNNLIASLFGFLLLIVIGYFFLTMQTSKLKKAADLSAQQFQNLTEQVGSLRKAEAPKNKNVQLEAELLAIENSLRKRQRITEILQNTNFGNTDGYSAYLTAFARQIPANLWLTGFKLEGAGYDLVLQGRTLQPELLPLYVAQLKREKIMQGKTFSALEMQRPALEVVAASVSAAVADTKKTNNDAPYLEFELHSSEAKEKAVTEAKSK